MNFSLLCCILLSFLNCARHYEKKPLPEVKLFSSHGEWSKKYENKSGNGEMIITGENFRFSSYFTFKYNVGEGVLEGKLLGSFGMVVGEFYFSRDSVALYDKEGKAMKNDAFAILKDISSGILTKLIMWELPDISKYEIVDMSDGWVAIGDNLEIFISSEFLPYRVSLKSREDTYIEYSDFDNTGDCIQPYRTVAKKGNNTLKLEYRKVILQ